MPANRPSDELDSETFHDPPACPLRIRPAGRGGMLDLGKPRNPAATCCKPRSLRGGGGGRGVLKLAREIVRVVQSESVAPHQSSFDADGCHTAKLRLLHNPYGSTQTSPPWPRPAKLYLRFFFLAAHHHHFFPFNGLTDDTRHGWATDPRTVPARHSGPRIAAPERVEEAPCLFGKRRPRILALPLLFRGSMPPVGRPSPPARGYPNESIGP